MVPRRAATRGTESPRGTQDPGGTENPVRRRRREQGLTQAELADAVDVSRQTVVAVERGDYAPSVYLALRIARTLGATVENLFIEENDMDGKTR